MASAPSTSRRGTAESCASDRRGQISSGDVADLPFQLPAPLAERLAAVADVEGKIPRALESLGPLAGRDVLLVDVPEGVLLRRLHEAGIHPDRAALSTPLRIERPDASFDALVTLWTGFRGIDAADLAEADRVLRPGGRLLVVHDYGRDDVSALRAPGAPEYDTWSRREGPFLRGGGFRLRVVHCFWTFESLDAARAFLGEAFGATGEALADRMKRPRLSWNVAVYHRLRGGVDPSAVVNLVRGDHS
jgi:SAM-dependent methyltransferase